MDHLEDVSRGLRRVATATRLLVACDFDDALAPDLGDPDEARAEQESSEALNVLMALPATTVAIVSRRDPQQVAELMRLSGSKGGLRHLGPEDVEDLRDEVDATGVVRLSAGDVGVTVATEAQPHGTRSTFVVEDTDAVADVLEELVRLRRGT